MDLTGIGRMLAMTPSDERSTLAALRFPGCSAGRRYTSCRRGEQRGVAAICSRPQHLTGAFYSVRFPSGSRRTAPARRRNPCHTADGRFHLSDLLAEYNGRIIPQFNVGARKKLTIITTDNQVTPQPGQTVISMVLLEGALRDADTARRLQAVRADGA